MRFPDFVRAAGFAAGGVAFAAPAFATNGDQMLGVTATQWGMAGAVVAAPQDAGTMITNPAGAATLGVEEVRFDMGVGVLNPPRRVNGIDSDSDFYMIPSGAVVFRLTDRLTAGMSMAGQSGMGVDFPDTVPVPGNQAIVTTKQFYKVAPGVAYQVTDALSIGLALNLDYQSLAMRTPTFSLPQNQVYGLGVTAGAIYKVNDMIQVGATWVSEQEMQDFHFNAGGPIEFQMNAPQQFAVGVAVRPLAGLLIEADVKHIAFSDVLGRIEVDNPARVPGIPAAFNFGWDDQWVFAIGAQYEVNPKTWVRVGYNFGESPIGPEDVDANIGSLAITEHHATVGLTRQLTDRIFGSLSYAHAFHNEVRSSISANVIELEQNVVNLQVTYRF